MQSSFDVFISYTRKDADFARGIAECLMSNGLHVWFDEYCIPLVPATRLHEALQEGINESRAAILVTNPDYVRAEIAFGEAVALLSRRPHIPILNIGRPADAETLERLRGITSHPDLLPLEATNFAEVIGLLEQFLGRNLSHDRDALSQQKEQAVVQWSINGIPVHLDVAGWQLLPTPISIGRSGSDGPTVARYLEGHRLDMNVNAGKLGMKRDDFCEINPDKRWEFYEWGIAMAQQYMRGQSPRMKQAFDRKLKDVHGPAKRIWCRVQLALLGVAARLWSSLLGNTCVGVHLFHQSGLNQFATTYKSRIGWSRKYSILVPDPLGGSDLEFVFTGGVNGSFQDFLRYAHRFDEYVGSLRYGDSKRAQPSANTRGACG